MKNSLNYKNEDLPDISALLSSLVRLMSCYVKEPSVSYAMTLVHIMQQIEKHPDLESNSVTEIAVKQAQLIWQEELFQARTRCSFNKNCLENKDGKIH